MKITFKPTEELLNIDFEWREKWAAALQTSKQAKGYLCIKDGSKCCLGVLESVYGKSDEAMLGFLVPSEMDSEGVTLLLNNLNTYVEDVEAAVDNQGDFYHFHTLNDSYLTHKQIAKLLLGNEVTIETES